MQHLLQQLLQHLQQLQQQLLQQLLQHLQQPQQQQQQHSAATTARQNTTEPSVIATIAPALSWMHSPRFSSARPLRKCGLALVEHSSRVLTEGLPRRVMSLPRDS